MNSLQYAQQKIKNNGSGTGRTSINHQQLRISALANNHIVSSLNGSMLLSPHGNALHFSTNESPSQYFET